MKTIAFIFILFATVRSYTQTPDSTSEQIKYYDFAEKMPEYKGGMKELYEFISSNIKYPTAAIDSCIQGTVYLKFVVKSNGEVINAVVLRGIGYGCDDEALRVINMMPAWIPGKQSGKEVDVYYKIPIKFTLDDDCETDPEDKKDKRNKKN